MPEEAPEGFELRYTEGDNLPYYQKIADIPSEPSDDLNNDPFARAASRMRRSVVHDRLPVQGREASPRPPDYLMGPDLLEAQQGQSLPTGMAYNDAGIPFNLKTGAEIPTVSRPNVLPVAMTPEGPRWAMPKMLDIAGNLMGGVAGVPAKAGEVVLGSGVVRKMAEEAPTVAAPFFSALSQAVDNAKLSKGSADQWLGYLKNQPGVKSEELSTVLGDLKGTLSKEDVQGLVKQNKVELGEVVKGGGAKQEDLDKEAMALYNKKYNELDRDHRMEVDDKFEAVRNNPTKYHGYQLPGESSNYKEMLLTLPEDKIYGHHAAWLHADYSQQLFRKYGNGIRNKATPEELKKLDHFDEGSLKKNPNYKSSHWDEPNIIAHIRHNDRMVEGKKTLHLEELQSDWHQKGRKEGYKLSEKQKADLDSIENKLTTKLTEAEIGNSDIDNVLKVAVDKKVISADDAKNYKDYVKGENSTVPDAPFKKNWDELALKRMLHKAANEGYEGLSWTPGEAQAARYDLSKTIDSIAYNPNTGYFKAIDKTGKDISTGPVPKEKLADTIGKEAADKLLKTEPNNVGIHSLQNADLKIGGEGMKTFYDKMLVDRANNLVKKYGSKVEQRDLPHGKEYKIEPISVRNMNGGNSEVYDVRFNQNGGEDRVIASYKTKAEAETKLKELQATKGEPIHYLPITDELRAKTKQGFPLFSTSPTLTAVQHDPFNSDKKYKLVPVEGNPFDPKANAAGIESHRNNGGRADLNNPISAGAAPSYGIRPPIMDPNNPEFDTTQPNSIE